MTSTLRMVRLRTPPRFKGLTLDSPAIKALQVDPEGPYQRWLDALREGRIVRAEGLLDTCGLGLWAVGARASALISSILTEAAAHWGYGGLYLSVSDFLDTMRPDGDDNLADRAHTEDLLVLANIGTQHGTDWSQATLRTLIVKRFENGLPTLVSSDILPEALLPDSFALDAFLTVAIMK